VAQSLDVTPQALAAVAATILEGAPVVMVNLVRYRDRADYGGERPDLPPCSGKEAYLQRYRSAFHAVTAGENIKAVFVGHALATIVAPEGERWDGVAVVEYPDFATIRRMFESERYRTEAAPHRRAALADWRFIATAKQG
jgi:uncharacterized protein (DUF1330 family)